MEGVKILQLLIKKNLVNNYIQPKSSTNSSEVNSFAVSPPKQYKKVFPTRAALCPYLGTTFSHPFGFSH